MHVLVNIKGLFMSDMYLENAETVFKYVNSVYNDTAPDNEAYLHEEEPEDIECIFGSDNPDAIVKAAEGWNKQLLDDFTHALKQVPIDLSPESLADYKYSSQIYALRKAAMAIDGAFYSYAEYALLVDSNATYFTTVLHTAELKEIQANPENYALIEVWPK